MELAMQIISNDKTLKSDTIQDLKDIKCKSLTTQAEKGKQLVSMMPAVKKAFDLMGDDIEQLSTETEALKNQTREFDQKWLEEAKVKLLKQIDDEERPYLIMSQMKRQMK